MNTQFANIATPTEVVVAVTFKIELEPVAGLSRLLSVFDDRNPSATCFTVPCRQTGWRPIIAGLNCSPGRCRVRRLIWWPTRFAPVTLGEILDLKVGDVISPEIPEAIVAEVMVCPFSSAVTASRTGSMR